MTSSESYSLQNRFFPSLELNDDVLDLIFKYLSLKQKFILRKVNKRFACILNKSLLNQKSLEIVSHSDDIIFNHYLKNECIEANLWSTKSHSILLMPKISKKAMERILMRCPNIKHLQIGPGCSLNVQTFQFMIQKCVHLEALLLNNRIAGIESKWKQLTQKHFKELRLLFINRPQNGDLMQIISCIPSLDSVIIKVRTNDLMQIKNNHKSITLFNASQQQIDALCNNNACKSITRLKVELILTEAQNCFDMICQHFDHLQHFDVTFSQVFSLAQINRMKNLKSLRIESHDDFIDFSTLASQPFENLSFLHIKGIYLTPTAIKCIVECFPNLIKLILDMSIIKCECIPNAHTLDCKLCYDACCKHVSALNKLFKFEANFPPPKISKAKISTFLPLFPSVKKMCIKFSLFANNRTDNEFLTVFMQQITSFCNEYHDNVIKVYFNKYTPITIRNIPKNMFVATDIFSYCREMLSPHA